MTTRWMMHRLLAGLVGAAGLSYPACAAVCPRGIGGCPYPGRCFLFTDVDANAVCDYTRTSMPDTWVSSPDPVTTASPASTIPGPVSTTASAPPALQPPPSAGAAPLVPPGPLLAGLAVFLVAAAAVYTLLRAGRAGPGAAKTGPALALSALFGLVPGEISAYLLSGEAALASLYATVYLLAGSVLGAYAWHRGAMTRHIVAALACMSVLFGFVILAPLMPVEFVGLVTAAAGSGSLFAPGMIGVLGAILLALTVGRVFCAHICPVGAVQELAYDAPVKKYIVGDPRWLEAMRAGVFVLSVASGLAFVNLMAYTGVYDFFSLSASIGFAVFAGLVALSAVVYRPVCRALCPFGLLFSLPAHLSRLRLRRTAACVDCGRCERACPAGVGGRATSKRECYLCGRCVDACRVKGALEYKPRG